MYFQFYKKSVSKCMVVYTLYHVIDERLYRLHVVDRLVGDRHQNINGVQPRLVIGIKFSIHDNLFRKHVVVHGLGCRDRRHREIEDRVIHFYTLSLSRLNCFNFLERRVEPYRDAVRVLDAA